ncbi:hypothetical protein F5148DRAFT_975031 [Russula earlei]|uniref:Uncharacterized protein n=1 Tax=Russula earlei TaxID=71964 RepID=A0ACC0UJS8_9AGAM|nr:hypothetical protein F5148DRAFT_975031 [Russula earlei]
MLVLSLFSLLLPTATFAATLHRNHTCYVPAGALKTPAPLSSPSSPPRYVTVGIGVQNYTCSPSGNYTSVGAVAELFDISCLYGKPEFVEIQNDAFNIWSNCPSIDPLERGLRHAVHNRWHIDVIGQHYFVNETGVLLPKFDFTSTGVNKGDPDAFVVAKKTADVPAPNHHDDVDWLELERLSGDLANEVFRVYTREGQPPSSCTPGSASISIKYTAQYCMYLSPDHFIRAVVDPRFLGFEV